MEPCLSSPRAAATSRSSPPLLLLTLGDGLELPGRMRRLVAARLEVGERVEAWHPRGVLGPEHELDDGALSVGALGDTVVGAVGPRAKYNGVVGRRCPAANALASVASRFPQRSATRYSNARGQRQSRLYLDRSTPFARQASEALQAAKRSTLTCRSCSRRSRPSHSEGGCTAIRLCATPSRNLFGTREGPQGRQPRPQPQPARQRAPRRAPWPRQKRAWRGLRWQPPRARQRASAWAGRVNQHASSAQRMGQMRRLANGRPSTSKARGA